MPPLIFPQQSTGDVLDDLVNQVLTLRIYTNNHTPQINDTAASYIEAVGGGYAAQVLNAAQWAVVDGSPSVALYNSFLDFVFTSVPAPATMYGYYITRANGHILLAEEFDPTDLPFTITIAGQTIQIRPRFGADNLIAGPVEIT